MKHTVSYFLIGAAVMSALVYFYLKTNHLVFAQYQRIDDDLENLMETNAALNQDILKSRFLILADYDGFTKEIEDLKRSAEDVGAAMPRFVQESERARIESDVNQLIAVIRWKEDLLEKFKSQNAVFNNSMSYLPLAGAELLEQLPDDGTNRELKNLLSTLMLRVLEHGFRGEDSSNIDLGPDLEKLKQWRALRANDPSGAALNRLCLHINSILSHRANVEAIARDLVGGTLTRKIKATRSLYDTQFGEALKRAQRYRMLLCMLCGLLVVAVGSALFALNKANRNLERRVQDRTSDLFGKNVELQAEIAERERGEAELQKLNRQITDVSRRAGMAEVATSVLHNVGNVLNSVNISCTVVSDRVRKSKVGSLVKTAELLRERSGNLGDFFTNDEAGRKLPDFIERLAGRLSADHALILSELDLLGQNVGHIKEIVAVQQSYAQAGGLRETLSIAGLVDDALRMNVGGLTRHGVDVIREIEDVPPVSVDKHKVLQILVNLIRNAKQALSEQGPGRPKQITVRVRCEEECASISVSDNGVGIASDHLTRIFAHGFTTKKEGHGFGLHSAVLFAREMGGSLKVFSKGPGQGATFTLHLPLGTASRAPVTEVLCHSL